MSGTEPELIVRALARLNPIVHAYGDYYDCSICGEAQPWDMQPWLDRPPRSLHKVDCAWRLAKEFVDADA